MRDLFERLDGFNYNFRMRCDCGAAVTVTPETYVREQSNAACVPCPDCDSEVHFGPSVAMIRRDDDPALDNVSIGQVAWYHSTTWEDWPSSSFERPRNRSPE